MTAGAVGGEATDALLTTSGLRRTKPRREILGVLLRHAGAMSHKELCEALSSSSLDRTTVYRNLIALTNAGVLVRRQVGDGLWRFEIPQSGGGGHAEHPHLVCDACGRLHCLPRGSVSLHGAATGCQVFEILLRGHCQSCLPDNLHESDATWMRE